MSESSRKALVVPIVLEKHNNADALSIVRVDGYQVVVNTAAWEGRDKAVWLEPETIVNTNLPVFSFLKREGRDKEVITAKRLRGEWSQGLLVPAPSGFDVGDDCWAALELEHYEPAVESKINAGDCSSAPKHWTNLGRYSIENYRKYNTQFIEGELVGLTEKCHGSFWAGVYSDGEYHVRSMGFWRKHDGNDYSSALMECEPLLKYLRDNANHLSCGEVIGRVQKGFSYGIPNGKISLRLFDIRKPDFTYLNVKEFRDSVSKYNLPAVRVIGDSELISHNSELIYSLAEGNTLENASHIREGLVVRPEKERFCNRINSRLILKVVSNSYLEVQGRR